VVAAGASCAIVANDATKVFLDGSVVAFRDLRLTVAHNETLCVVGPSGCGKTTFLRCVAGLIELTSGELLVNGAPVRGVADGVALVFQHFGLLPWKTVYQNAAFGLAMAGAPPKIIQQRVDYYLDLVGLRGFERHYPYQLSGGMQQRVGLVRALATNPSILLLDEPFAALDAQTREVLQEELLRIMQHERKTMVFVTHSIDEAILLGDRVAVLSARPGRLREMIEVPFPRPRQMDGLGVRADPRFAELREHIWSDLRPEAAAAV
jgi:NitT/TauT family transport system ATP-binding protein